MLLKGGRKAGNPKETYTGTERPRGTFMDYSGHIVFLKKKTLGAGWWHWADRYPEIKCRM